MLSNGKIWVVIIVILVIQTVIFLYLIILDKKISRFEKNQMSKTENGESLKNE